MDVAKTTGPCTETHQHMHPKQLAARHRHGPFIISLIKHRIASIHQQHRAHSRRLSKRPRLDRRVFIGATQTRKLAMAECFQPLSHPAVVVQKHAPHRIAHGYLFSGGRLGLFRLEKTNERWSKNLVYFFFKV